MKRDFEKFLKRHRVYQRYFRNLKAQNDDPEIVYKELLRRPKGLIREALNYPDTPEHTEKYPDFWPQVEKLWDKELKRIERRKHETLGIVIERVKPWMLIYVP